MATQPQSRIRQRTVVDTGTQNSQNVEVVETEIKDRREEVVWGKTPSGEVFRVPTTHDVLTLFHPSYVKSHLDLLNLALLGLQLIIFVALPRSQSRTFFLLYFAFWRGAYDAGLGWVLTKQSKKKWIVKEVQRLGWLDENRCPKIRNWIRAQLAGKMGKDYSFDDLPLEYNTWLLFRQAVDVILLNDFLSYCMFAFSCFRVPDGLSTFTHIMRWVGGFALIGFNLWVKTEAHNVVKDYGWYWGDVFFARGALIFDGVFELAPHPMYSVGYAGYYGLSLISGSYRVLFVSLAAHTAQFAFLVLFENPHIERMYGQRKRIAKREPLLSTSPNHSRQASVSTAAADAGDILTPSATEGESAIESDLETDTETEVKREPLTEFRSPNNNTAKRSRTQSHKRTSSRGYSQHDLLNKYFRRDALLLRNLDFFRASDFMLIVLIIYALAFTLLPRMSDSAKLALHFAHALAWSLFHSFGLGLVLRAQSENKFLVRHFMKHYYYSPDDGAGAVQEAFTNWKSIYNLSMCISYLSFFGLFWQTYNFPSEWTAGNNLLRHTMGAVLMGLHIWASKESYEVLGVFGWFFGDFFMEEFPASLDYTGIYRYINNPEITSRATFFALALISGSKLVIVLSVIGQLSHWWFLTFVESPHMQRVYGDSLRKDAGFVKVIKSVASKNARILESRAGRHAPEIKRVAKEVIGTFDKVYEETADAVEEFLAKSRPMFTEVVQDTKVLLQQSRERLVITRIANDISSYDASKYSVSIEPGERGTSCFHLGEPIVVKWKAPINHSRKDWIGIYRVGANKSKLVTKTSSMGMWAGVYGEDWDGDVYVGAGKLETPSNEIDEGSVTFMGNTLPWLVGRYEIRYHHDGKYNVMSLGGPFEIFVEKPSTLTFDSVRDSLMHIVPLCLDSDESLIPLSCKTGSPIESSSMDYDRDPDDFSFWSERQAKRIANAIKQTFEVEYAPEVIVADANLTSLANRILLSKQILPDTS